MSEPILFHIDVNSAYLSWEAVYRLRVLKEPLDLRTVPSAVGGSMETRHGIIYAKSRPAEKYGIRTAQTVASALRKCPGLIIVPPHHELYSGYSEAFMNILKEYSPSLERFSIDEAFLDMTETASQFGGPLAAADAIGDRIREELGFTVNIGISVNKLLAKTASDFSKPDKRHTLWPAELAEKFWPMPVSRLLYAGPATVKKLKSLGIHTIGELASSDPSILRSHLGKHGSLLYDYANGRDPSPVISVPADSKCCGSSTTMPHDVTGAAEAKKYLLSLCKTVCARLHESGSRAASVSVILKDCRLEKRSHQKTLSSPVNTVSELYPEICLLFDELWDGAPLRLLGVSTSRITREPFSQIDLFHMEDYEKQTRLDRAVDEIRSRFGDHSIRRASCLKGAASPEEPDKPGRERTEI